mgnify:CR=1 FL=1
MTATPAFKAAFPYQQDVLDLPVSDLDAASEWYSKHFGMVEVARTLMTDPKVILKKEYLD